MEINQNPLGRVENIIIRDPEHLTIKYIPVQNGTEMGIETQLVGTVTRTELIEREIIFDAPNKDVVLKVVSVLEDVEVKDVNVANATILVNGYLNSCIMYTTMKRPEAANNNQSSSGYMSNNKNNENNKNNNKEKAKPKPSCDLVDYSIAVDGVVRHTTVRIPFKAFLPAAEYQENDICTVKSTNLLKDLGASSMTLIYEEENEVEQAKATATTTTTTTTTTTNTTTSATTTQTIPQQKFVRGIINKTLIELTVDIKRYI
jgi:hypothetical protein